VQIRLHSKTNWTINANIDRRNHALPGALGHRPILGCTDFIQHPLGVAALPRRAVMPSNDDLATLRVTGANLDWPISLTTPTERTPEAATRPFEHLVKQ
jgi:hypothetical protein